MAAGALTTVSLAAETLRALREHARATYPNECCGLILRRGGREEVRPIRNIQDELHAADPERYPRPARIAYYMDGKELLAVLRTRDPEAAERLTRLGLEDTLSSLKAFLIAEEQPG